MGTRRGNAHICTAIGFMLSFLGPSPWAVPIVLAVCFWLLVACVGEAIPEVDGPRPRLDPADPAPAGPATGAIARLPKEWILYSQPLATYGMHVLCASGGTAWEVTGCWSADPATLEGHPVLGAHGYHMGLVPSARRCAAVGTRRTVGAAARRLDCGQPRGHPAGGAPMGGTMAHGALLPWSCSCPTFRWTPRTARLSRSGLSRVGTAGAGSGSARDRPVHGR